MVTHWSHTGHTLINNLDESGEFEGYIDMNGCDLDWSTDIKVKGNIIHLWGSGMDGVCCLKSK